MDAAPKLLIGSIDSDHLLVVPMRWAFPDTTDYWDGNWIHSTVSARAGAFRASLKANFRTDEFLSFRDALRPLYDSLRGEAMFTTMEHWLTIKVVGDGIGHFKAECEVCDNPTMGNRLLCDLAFDQTELPAILRDLDELLRAFPIRGSRGVRNP